MFHNNTKFYILHFIFPGRAVDVVIEHPDRFLHLELRGLPYGGSHQAAVQIGLQLLKYVAGHSGDPSKRGRTLQGPAHAEDIGGAVAVNAYDIRMILYLLHKRILQGHGTAGIADSQDSQIRTIFRDVAVESQRIVAEQRLLEIPI